MEKITIQFSSVVQSCLTLCDPMQPSLSITNSQSLLKLMSRKSLMPSNHLILSSPSPPTFNLSQHQSLFQWVSSSHQVAKVLEFQLQHQSFQWMFRTDFLDWLDLFVVQGTLTSLLQHHSSKASVLQHSAFFIVQLSHSYMTTGKIISLTRRTFVDKVISLFFNAVYIDHSFPSKEQASFNFKVAATICSDFGAAKK